MTQGGYLEPLDRYQSWQKLPYNLILSLLVSGLLILSIPLYLTYKEIRDDISRLQAENGEPDPSRVDTSAPKPSLADEELAQELGILQEQLSQFETVGTEIRKSYIYWPQVIKAIKDFDQSIIRLESIRQVGREISINGRSGDDSSLSLYLQNLAISGMFSDVRLESDMPDDDASAGQVQFSIEVNLKEDVE